MLSWSKTFKTEVVAILYAIITLSSKSFHEFVRSIL